MTNHPVESLLRPIPEFNTALVAFASGLLLLLAPDLMMMVPSIAHVCAVLLFCHGGFWSYRGWLVKRYQRNLRRPRSFLLNSDNIPSSRRWLYLGNGFIWKERHTQRLHDSRRNKFRKYVDHSWAYHWVRRHESRFDGSLIYRFFRSQSALNPFPPAPDAGGSVSLHGVEPNESRVLVPLEDRNGHMLVLGTTGVGKTRLAELMIAQDIRRGDVTIVIDPKGDADLLARVRVEAERAGRGRDLYIFHLGYPEISARYNAIGHFTRTTEIASRLANQLSSEGNSAAFREFAWRFTHIVASALVSMGRRPDFRSIAYGVANIDVLLEEYVLSVYREQPDIASNIDSRARELADKDIPRNMRGRSRRAIAIELVVSERKLSDPVLDGLRSALQYDKNWFDKIIASLLPLLEKLVSGKAGELLSPNYTDPHDERPIFDWRKVVNQKAVVYVGLDALSDPVVSAAVGNSMFADLVSYAGQRYKFGDGSRGIPVDATSSRVECSVVRLHCDEFNELMGDEFIPMINKGRGAGLQITAYSQTLSDIMARAGSRAKAIQVVANFNSLIMMRVKDRETAALLTEQLPTVDVVSLTVIAGYNETSDVASNTSFTSRYEDRITSTQVTMIEPHDVMKLPKGQAFMLSQGGELTKIRFPVLKTTAGEFDTSFQALLGNMRQRYRSAYYWWEGTLR